MPNDYQVRDAYGSVITIQSSIYGSAHRQVVVASIMGAVPISFPSGANVSISGTVGASIIGTVPITMASSVVVAVYRNDTLASILGADLTYRQPMGDSAGRVVIRPFAAEEARIEGIAVLTSTSVTTMVAAAGTGLKNYVTDLWVANTGSVSTLVTLKDGLGSILGYTIAPATSGSNLPGLLVPIRTGANATFDIQAGTATSTLYATVKGFKGP